MQKVCNDLICFPELKEKALALREAIQREYEQTYDNEKNSTNEFDFSRRDTSNRISAFAVARDMLFFKGIQFKDKDEQYAARALGASLEYLSKKKALTKENLVELWKEPKNFFNEIREDEEMTYGLTGLYQLLQNNQTDIFNAIIKIIKKSIES